MVCGLLDLRADVSVADSQTICVRQVKDLPDVVLFVLGRVEEVDPQNLVFAQIAGRVSPLLDLLAAALVEQIGPNPPPCSTECRCVAPLSRFDPLTLPLVSAPFAWF